MGLGGVGEGGATLGVCGIWGDSAEEVGDCGCVGELCCVEEEGGIC